MGMSLAPWKRDRALEERRRVEEMADELCRSAADLSAAEYRWLRLLAEFDAADGWVAAGARSCAAWLSWACGLSPEAARERVRVARALPELPKVCASFGAGRLSYSKVRAISRVADAGNEELLVSYGESATAAQLEKVLRGYRRVSGRQAAHDAQALAERAYLRYRVDEDGCLRVTARLAPEDGAFFLAQLERMAATGGEDRPAPAAAEDADVSAETAESGRGDTPVVSDRWDASTPVERRRATALRLMAETAAANGPTACRGGDTHLVVVHSDRDALQTPPDDGGTPVAARNEDPGTRVGAAIEGVGRVSAETARRLACDAEVVHLVEDALGRPLGIGRQSKKVPRWLRRALMRRDRGCCQFPGCPARRFVDAHHIKHWADGGPTDLDNLVVLCRFHHRLVHEVGYGIRIDAPGEFTFLRPDGTPVPVTAPRFDADARRVEVDNARLSLNITALTAIPDWDGTSPDSSLAVELLQNVSAETPLAATGVP